MPQQMSRRQMLAGGAALGAGLLSGCTSMTPFVGQRVDEELSIPIEGDALRVRGEVGRIRIRGEERDDIDVDLTKQSSSVRTDLDDLTLEREVNDGVLELRSEWAADDGWFESQPSMEMDIRMPRSFPLEEVRTSTGRIDIEDVSGDLDVETSTGQLNVRNVDGAVRSHTSTGQVNISDVAALRNVSTSTGAVNVDVLSIEEDTQVSTSTGRISAAIDPALDLDIRASTNTGRVSVSGLELSDSEERNDFLIGQLGEGGPQLSFETNTGRISLSAYE